METQARLGLAIHRLPPVPRDRHHWQVARDLEMAARTMLGQRRYSTLATDRGWNFNRGLEPSGGWVRGGERRIEVRGLLALPGPVVYSVTDTRWGVDRQGQTPLVTRAQ
ncbi:hypothetical protein RRG08_019461 [Elysia crispata]|uniref:Uncharacterized protein n=1 Tax=Elysia crispata TaxID=231223 RepID=A0AAE1DSH8_9GAST|nr:hypothetical protein RRG08_019461 [Elysia crispata]